MTLQGWKISPYKLRPEKEAGEWRGFGLFHLLVFAPPLPHATYSGEVCGE